MTTLSFGRLAFRNFVRILGLRQLVALHKPLKLNILHTWDSRVGWTDTGRWGGDDIQTYRDIQ